MIDAIPDGRPILTARQMRESDRRAIDELGVPGPVLMENASRGALDLLARHLGGVEGRRIVVLCGRGNNAGDGLALARLALVAGADVRCILAFDAATLSADAALQRRILEKLARASITTWQAFQDEAHSPADAIVDAMLGTGSRSAPEAPFNAMIAWANSVRCFRFALDIPTGLDAVRGTISPDTYRADATATMAALKPGLLLGDGPSVAGRVDVVHIGLPASWYAGSGVALLDKRLCCDLLPAIVPGRHKYDRGKTLVIGGSRGMSGAPAMSAGAALAAGAGLVVLAQPAGDDRSPHPLAPEIMTRLLPAADSGAFSSSAIDGIGRELGSYAAIAIGPGLSREESALEFARAVVGAAEVPVVVDADGIGAFVGRTEELAKSRGKIVITPHHGEMAKLLGIERTQITSDPLGIAIATASALGITVVLKGAPTLVALPDGRAWINGAGNPGMATAGSGDVLTGVIAALVGQTGSAARGTLAGVYLHSLAGDVAAESRGLRSVRATDITAGIPEAYRRVESRR